MSKSGGPGIPGYELVECIREVFMDKEGNLIILGDPSGIPNHNCIRMGCGRRHVILRGHATMFDGMDIEYEVDLTEDVAVK